MKKILLGTTAVVALSTLSTEAFALNFACPACLATSMTDDIQQRQMVSGTVPEAHFQQAESAGQMTHYFKGTTTLEDGTQVVAEIKLDDASPDGPTILARDLNGDEHLTHKKKADSHLAAYMNGHEQALTAQGSLQASHTDEGTTALDEDAGSLIDQQGFDLATAVPVGSDQAPMRKAEDVAHTNGAEDVTNIESPFTNATNTAVQTAQQGHHVPSFVIAAETGAHAHHAAWTIMPPS